MSRVRRREIKTPIIIPVGVTSRVAPTMGFPPLVTPWRTSTNTLTLKTVGKQDGKGEAVKGISVEMG